MYKVILFLLIANMNQLQCPEKNIKGCNDIEIIPKSINERDLEKWYAVDFQFSNDSLPGILLIPKNSTERCLDIEKVRLDKNIALCMEKEFFYTHSQDSIGVRLYGRFDVEVTETGKPFVFPREVPVYKCKSR